jgi:hypothetical protein
MNKIITIPNSCVNCNAPVTENFINHKIYLCGTKAYIDNGRIIALITEQCFCTENFKKEEKEHNENLIIPVSNFFENSNSGCMCNDDDVDIDILQEMFTALLGKEGREIIANIKKLVAQFGPEEVEKFILPEQEKFFKKAISTLNIGPVKNI